MNRMKRLTGRKILLATVALCAFGIAKAQNAQAEMKLNDMSFKMGQDGTNTANAGLSINLPLFAPAVYRTM